MQERRDVMKLVIVESPAKSKTIQNYLGEDYIVESSIGHIRDLSIKGKGGFGVDINNNFKPDYVILKDKHDVVKKLKEAANQADHIYLATDPDREGEAISWHLSEVLEQPSSKVSRIVFNEITKSTILKSIKKITYRIYRRRRKFHFSFFKLHNTSWLWIFIL